MENTPDLYETLLGVLGQHSQRSGVFSMGSSSERDKVLRTHPTTRAGARANTPFLLCHSFVRNSLITFDKFCPSTRVLPIKVVQQERTLSLVAPNASLQLLPEAGAT